MKFRRQHPIGNFIADFYCHQLRLVIEIDGGYHLDKHQKEYDENRGDEMLNYGIEIIRFTNKEINYAIENVLERLSQRMEIRDLKL